MSNQFVVIFFDKSVKFLPANQAQFLIEQSTGGQSSGIKIGEAFYRFSSISKIIPTEEYWKEYPDRRPETTSYKNFYNDKRENYIPIERTVESRAEDYNSLIEGIQQYIDEQVFMGNNPKNAIALLENKKQRFNQLFKTQNP